MLHKQGRKQIVFGVGNPRADLMFIGEAPGADEDQQGEPFVGRAGQLLNNMIKAMGMRREDVYIANIIKCRPPGNRTPEREECETCSPFLMRQIAAIKPKAIVALGAVAAKTLLAINAPMSEFRGRWFDFRGTKLAVTYHPAFLLRDPRQKKETWKDLQMVMKELGLAIPAKGVEYIFSTITGDDARAYTHSRNGAVKSLAGNITAAHTNSNTPCTAMPTIRNGSSSSHTNG